MIWDDVLGANVTQLKIDFSTANAHNVVAGIAGTSIKVLQVVLVVAGTTNVTFKSGTTALSGAMPLVANNQLALSYNQLPLTCNAGDAFNIDSSQAVQVSGTIWYVQS